MDEGGEMDAMGLGWVVQEPAGARPLILEKSGGLQGEFSYVAFAPSRGIGVFVSINAFSVEGFDAMSKAVNELISPRANAKRRGRRRSPPRSRRRKARRRPLRP
jgi:D-alanyl-D-alanine-carboxypeptidase/D-alanyl-D-alanine-endopeptidase